MTCFILTGKLEFGQNSLIPPLPSILVNGSTQEMIMTHCLSNTVAPDASDVICLSVYDQMCPFVSHLLYACVLPHRRSTFFTSVFVLISPFLLQVCVLCDGGDSPCGYTVYSYDKMATQQRGQTHSGVCLSKHRPQPLWDHKDQRLLQ